MYQKKARQEGQQWYLANDSQVAPVNMERLPGLPYLLVLERVNAKGQLLSPVNPNEMPRQIPTTNESPAFVSVPSSSSSEDSEADVAADDTQEGEADVDAPLHSGITAAASQAPSRKRKAANATAGEDLRMYFKKAKVDAVPPTGGSQQERGGREQERGGRQLEQDPSGRQQKHQRTDRDRSGRQQKDPRAERGREQQQVRSGRRQKDPRA